MHEAATVDSSLFDRVLDFVGAARRSGPEKSSPVRVGLAVNLNGGPLAPGFRRFRLEHPETELMIHEGDVREDLQRLQRGFVDVVFAYENRVPIATMTTLLWREPMMILLPERHALAGRSCISEHDLTGARVLATAGQMVEPLGSHLQVLARQGRLTLVSRMVERDTLAGLVRWAKASPSSDDHRSAPTTPASSPVLLEATASGPMFGLTFSMRTG